MLSFVVERDHYLMSMLLSKLRLLIKLIVKTRSFKTRSFMITIVKLNLYFPLFFVSVVQTNDEIVFPERIHSNRHKRDLSTRLKVVYSHWPNFNMS